MANSKSDFLKQLFFSLNTNYIEYFVIGEYHNLPKNTGNSDLDIMISPKDIKRSVALLPHIFKKNNIKIVSYYKNNNGIFYRLISKSDIYWGLQLDLFFKGFFYQTKEYFPIDELKRDILFHQGIRVLDLRKAYFIGFLKEIIHKGWSKEKYINGFIDEVSSNNLKYRNLFRKLYGSLFVDIVFNNLSSDNLKSKTNELGKIIFKQIFHGRTAFLENIIVKIKYLKRAFNKPGYTIVFLGTDGSGKSTIIDIITPILNEAFHNSVYYEHLRPNMIPSIAKLFGKNDIFNGPVTEPHSKRPSGFIGSFFRYSYYLIDYSFGYWLKIYTKQAFHSCVYIFDRYYYDFLIDPYRFRLSLPKWLLKAGQILLPEMDIIVCLGTLPETIHARKPELTLDEVTRQVHDLSLFCKNHKNAVWVDTGGSIEQSVEYTMNAISKIMTLRFKSINP